jgi:hypothetical protein
MRHTPKEYSVGDIVGLSTRNFKFKISRKFTPRFIPVKILRRIGTQAYKVVLPTKYAAMHSVFPVTLLEPWTATQNIDKMPLPDLENEQEVWEVEDIEKQGYGARPALFSEVSGLAGGIQYMGARRVSRRCSSCAETVS